MKRKRLLLTGALMLLAFGSTGCIYHGHGHRHHHGHRHGPPCGPYNLVDVLVEVCPPSP